ncbi:MAG: MMPL family transporter [Alphaproteobacteria bacterium]|nr:MMPL family transporter [Alphaproteobacteria bacterium]
MENSIVNFAIEYPKRVFGASIVAVIAILLAIALPFVVPDAPMSKLKIDTDPENMLSVSEPARVLNSEKSARFLLHDSIVIAIENDRSSLGVFTPTALSDVKSLSDFAATIDGVIAEDIFAPGTIEIAEPDATGVTRLVSIMPDVPANQAAAIALRDRMLALPMLNGTMVSADGGALTLAIPIADKAEGRRIAGELSVHIDGLGAGNSYNITGLPVAQSVFGVEMFIQMAVAAPAAMLLIFLLLFAIFRSWWVAAMPLGIAMVATIGAMGTLVLTGNTLHIMSSMIPIFVMPIAVMDAIHVLSEFADRHDPARDRKQTIRACLKTLWRPMFFTTITTMAGFASLALAPIPPVQVFGLFVALGVALAWFATVVIVPAALVKIPEGAIAKIVRANRAAGTHWTAHLSLGHPRLVLSGLVLVALVLMLGLWRIQINDTPMRWFASGHPIRTAEVVLTDRFAGAHQAYLSLKGAPGAFLEPDMLNYVDQLTDYARNAGHTVKTFALPDLLRSVYRTPGDQEGAPLPTTRIGVAQLLEAIEQAGKGDDLRKLVTPGHDEMVIRFHMADGDNLAMRALEDDVSYYLAGNKPPSSLSSGWFGLTYLNAVWQDRMVSGMLDALIGSFIAVFLLLIVLFRSVSWAVVSMVPLTFAIGGIYGAIGWIGRDFDMPIAVLSTLSLGLAVDFAIHFVSRIRDSGAVSLLEKLLDVYQEPARAIERNTIVLGVGFLPLVFSPLIPYRTVGILIPTIIGISAIATLLVLGAMLAAKAERRPAPPVATGRITTEHT